MRFQTSPWSILAILSLVLNHVSAVDIDIDSADSIKDAASEIAYGLMKWYTGNNTGDVPGNLPDPYYWWEAGAMFMSMVEYWYYTGDETYVPQTKQALIHQTGDKNDYMPTNQTLTEGNDDQLFWALAAMSAAELKFSDPGDLAASWVAQAQAVFNEQAARWDGANCDGGLRWQIYSFNAGWNYKNTISNGGFFQLAARLARYTGNETYVDWAEKMWDWAAGTVILDTDTWTINDGTSVTNNCSTADHTQWTYNYGTFIVGCAFLYNHTENEIWKTRASNLLKSTYSTFFPDYMTANIMVEVTCEPSANCDYDQSSFKAYLSRWLALTAQMIPDFYEEIFTKIRASAKGAAGQCSGSAKTAGNTCGREWNSTVWDGTYGVGEQMAALQIVGALMIDKGSLDAPVTYATGGTSKSDGSAGTGSGASSTDGTYQTLSPISAGDKAGAAILTIAIMVGTLGGAAWMMMGDF